jgi:hypothetical protein
MNEWVWWSGDIPNGNPKCSINPRPNADLFTANSTRTGLGPNPRLRCGRWVLKRLSYGSGRIRSHGSVAGRGNRLASSNGGAIRYECVDKVVQSSNASVCCAMWISVCPYYSTRRSIISWVGLLSLYFNLRVHNVAQTLTLAHTHTRTHAHSHTLTHCPI